MSASELKVKQKGVIKEILVEDKLQRQRLLDFGFIKGSEITCYKRVFGTYAFEVKGSIIAIRKETSNQIILE